MPARLKLHILESGQEVAKRVINGEAQHPTKTLGFIGCLKQRGGRTFDLITVMAFPFGRSDQKPRILFPRLACTPIAGGASPRCELLATVDRPKKWADQLRSGEVHSLGDIATKEGLSIPRVSQLLPLANLTPAQIDHIRSRKRPSIRKLIDLARRSDASAGWPPDA